MPQSSAPSPSSLTAVLLAGGLGTRLRSVVSDRPKVMALVAGRPCLEYWLEALVGLGIRRAVLCTGYGAEFIQAHFGDRFGELELVYSREDQPLGTGGALALALAQRLSDPFLVLNADSFLRADLGAFLAWFGAEARSHALLALAVEDRSRYGGLELDGEGRVRAFLEKGEGGPGLVNAGVYLLRAEALRGLPLDRPTSLEREVFPALATQGALQAHVLPGSFLDIGTPESYAEAPAFFTGNNEGGPPGRGAVSASPLVLPHGVSGPSPSTPTGNNEGGPPGRGAVSASPLVLPHGVPGLSPSTPSDSTERS